MKKKGAILALILAGALSFGVFSTAGCKKRNEANGGDHTVQIPDGDTPTTDNPDNPGGENPSNPGGDTPVNPGGDTPAAPGESVSVTYVNDGVTVISRSLEKGKIDSPPTVTKDGHYFGGWYTNAECTGNAFDFSNGLTSDYTFHAKWIKLNTAITYSEASYESAVFEWTDTNASGAKVEYKLSGSSAYTQVDKELLRAVDSDTVRVDVLGLKGGASYDFRITTSAGSPMEVSGMRINAYDRSGYAHFKYSEGVGAYNDDGTLKDNAIVIYVTNQNKDTVMKEVAAKYDSVKMFQIPGNSWGHKDADGIGWWLNNNQYTASNVGSDKNKSPSNTYDQANGGTLGFKSVNAPVVVRFIGTVETPEGCTAYNSVNEGGGVGDNGHMARLKNLKNVTLEGVGTDAQIKGWGFHYVKGTDAKDGQGESFEVRNLTFTEYPEDAIGMEGQQSGTKITAGVARCWIHHNTFLPGRCDNPAESDKAEGDGSCDFKRGEYFTCSYNYFEYCHKTNLVGSSDSSLQYNMTYHHNMWYQCGSRIPLTRQANVHFYNNYVCYDATEKTTPYSHISKPAGSYVHSLRANCYIFSEANYYEGSKNVTDGKSGGVAKGWNNMYYANFGTNTIVEAKSRTEKVTNKCAYGSVDYSSFDTNPDQFYYNAQTKSSDCYITDAATARKEVIDNVGVLGFTPRVKADMLDKKPETAVSVPKDGLTIDLTKATVGGNVNGVYFVNAKNSSGAAKGKGVLAMFTLADRADITVSATGSGDSIGELVRIDGTVIAGKFTSYTGTLEAGTYFIASGQKDKDCSITALSFKSGVTDAQKVQSVVNYINAIGTVENTEECRNKIEIAQTAYNGLGDDLKKNVTNADKLTAAVNAYNKFAVDPVIALINAIGTVNVNSGIAIAEARTAYGKLTAAQQALVTNYATLVAAEKAYESFEVEGVNNAIAALAAPETATTEQAIRELAGKYDAVNEMYASLDEDQKTDVKNIAKVTAGIAALENALKPYELRDGIANLPAKADIKLSDAANVSAIRKDYDKLNAEQKAIVGDITKLTEAEAVIKELASQTKVAIFDKNKTNLATDAGFNVTGNYKGTSDTFTYNGTEYSAPLKIESSTSVTFNTATEMRVTIKLHTSGNSLKIKLDGTSYTANSDGIIVIEKLAEGNHSFGRDGEAWLCYVELSPIV